MGSTFASVLAASLILFAALPGCAQQAGASPAPNTPAPRDPVLVLRPPANAPRPPSPIAAEGHIRLDVSVIDASGNAVSGLQPWDFTVLDNNQPRKILTFRSFDGVTVKPDPPIQVILLIDTANLPFQQVAFVQSQVRKFLLQNGGRLAYPVSLFLLSDAGLRVQPRPSTDGNALVRVLDQIQGGIRAIDSAQGGEGLIERFQLSVRELAYIAQNMTNRPGRKLLIWVGPGWPMLDSAHFVSTQKDRRRYFDSIVALSHDLRAARIVLDSVSPADPASSGAYDFTYRSFLKGVTSLNRADSGNLSLKVLATQSGGLVLGPDNDLVGQIDSCIAGAGAFYRISFNPPRAAHADEYHELKLEIDKPGLTARTSSGYYNQP
jgi:VWFA-related protein